MEKFKFDIEINALKERVWNVLWEDATFREWSGIIDKVTYLKGDLKEGHEVEFISAEGYGVTSLVEKLVPNELILFRHKADTIDSGKNLRSDEWTGGTETFSLVQKDNLTTLYVEYDLPLEQKEYFKREFPKALAMVKDLAER